MHANLLLAGLISASGAAAAAFTGPLTLRAPWSNDDWTIKGDVEKTQALVLGPKPGSQASVWSEKTVNFDEWTIDVYMRALSDDVKKSADRSGFALWYTSEKLSEGPVHGSADNWDGFALMMDSLGWDDEGSDDLDHPGSIRGYLNDGSYKFASAKHAAEMAFSLCRYEYRNAPGIIRLRVGYGQGSFIVEVNGQRCFSTDQVVLPRGYVGISADTSSSPDTFHIDSLSVKEGLDAELASHVPGLESKPAAEAQPQVGGAPAYEREKAGAASDAISGEQAYNDPRVVEELAKLHAKLDNDDKNEIVSEILKLSSRFDGLRTSLAAQMAAGNSEEGQKAVAGLSANTEALHDEVRALSVKLDRANTRLDKIEMEISRQLTEELRLTRGEITREMSKPANLGFGFFILIASNFAVIVAVIVSHRRQRQHQKLL